MSTEKYDVLFVDDDPNILKAINRNLHGKYKVCVSSNIDEAVKLIGKHNFPIVFSDMQMPQMNGADFLIIVKEKSPDSIRILLTGETDVSDAIKAINESDIYKILLKPCSHEKICSTIDTALKLYNAQKIEELLMDKSLKGFVHIMLDLLNVISPEIFKRSIDITKIVRSPRTNFTLLEPWSFEVSCLLMYLGSVHYKIYNFDKIYGTENLEKVIRKSASLLSKVPKFEPVHQILNELADYYSNKVIIQTLDSDSKTLKLLVDYHSLVGDSKLQEKLKAMYSCEIIKTLPSLFGKQAKQKKALEVSVGKLSPGMITTEDVKTTSGSIIISKGETVIDRHISTLKVFVEKGYLLDKIKIQEN